MYVRGLSQKDVAAFAEAFDEQVTYKSAISWVAKAVGAKGLMYPRTLRATAS